MKIAKSTRDFELRDELARIVSIQGNLYVDTDALDLYNKETELLETPKAS